MCSCWDVSVLHCRLFVHCVCLCTTRALVVPSNHYNHTNAFQHQLGACDDSLCLLGKILLSVSVRTSDVWTASVRQQNLISTSARPASITIACDLTIHHLVG